jgi:hypothetical protein
MSNVKNRKSRTSPQTEAEAPKPKQKNTPKKYPCNKCDFQTTNESMLSKHIATNHVDPNPFTCYKFQFATTSAINLSWHKEAIHRAQTQNNQNKQRMPDIKKKVLKPCNFWPNGFCRYSDQECRFLHKNPPRCKFQMDCMAWPDCGFSHEEN